MAAAIRKANSTKPEDVIHAWEGMSYEGLTGTMTMRACDHQVITPIPVAEILAGPGAFYKFPYVGKPIMLSAEKGMVPPGETGNPRCK